MTDLRDAVEPDFADIVRLNAAEVRQTSPMDLDRVRLLHRLASYHRVATEQGKVIAFLLVMREGAAYENDNYEWFAARYPQFLYIDRIVVDAEHAGRGIGSRLYGDLFDYARQTGIESIVCEYNIQPPNPASQAFHARWGFSEVGSQHVDGGTKYVSLQAAEVPGGER